MEKQITENMFSKENIKANPNIRLTDFDEDTGLELYCYNQCGNSDSAFLKSCRGIVFDREKLIMKAFPYTDEYSHTKINELQELLKNFQSFSFYKSYEGTLLRLFYFSGKWFLTTHRKLNAFKSRWSGQYSFGCLFSRALEHEYAINENFKNTLGETGDTMLEKFYSSLDKELQYMFLVRNTSDNRIVCLQPSDVDTKLFSIGYFKDGIFHMNSINNLKTPEKIKLNNLSELEDYFKNEVNPTEFQGLVALDGNNFKIKIVHNDYEKLFNIRGNEPSIKFRYLQLRMDKEKVNQLNQLYPEMIPVFESYEKSLFEIAKTIHKAYIQRFIKKNFITVPKEEFLVIGECHSWHISNREQNRISVEKVIAVLNRQPPININAMIRRFIGENQKKHIQPRLINNTPEYRGSYNESLPTPLLLCNTAKWKN